MKTGKSIFPAELIFPRQAVDETHTHTPVDGTSMKEECIAVECGWVNELKLQPRVDRQVCAVRFLT